MKFSFPSGAMAALTACFLLVPARLHAEGPALPKKVGTVEGITEYQLDNGVRILLFPDMSSPKVTVNLTVLVGSRHEGYGETGMAHLLEHMVFKGTPKHPDVPKALRDHGANFNGTTWVDRTNYFETMNASDANLEFGIMLEADRLVNSFVKREDLISEMTVVRNEFEMGENSPSNILSQRMTSAAYNWHNYGKSTIGNRSDIERVPIENLQAFYHKFYQPDNVILAVAGNFDEKKALGYIAKYFGALKRPTRKLDQTYTEEPAQDGERNVVLRRVGEVGVVGVMYHIPAGSHPDFAALEVLNSMMVAEPNGLLYKALEVTKKATNVSGVAYGWHDPGIIEFSAQVDRTKPPEEVRDQMIAVVEGLHKTKISAEDVDRAKQSLLAARARLMNDSNRIGVALSDWAAKGDWRLFFLHRDRLEKVTPEDVARVSEKYFKQSNRTVGLYLPTDKSERTAIPEAPAVTEILKDYKGRDTVAAGEAFDPTPENIEKRVQRAELPSGVKLALLPKKSRGEEVIVRMTLRFGNEDSLKGNVTAAEMLGTMLMRGSKSHTRQQLKDELDKLKASMSVSSNTTGEVAVSIQCTRQTLPTVLKLLHEVLREPTFPADEFEVLKNQELKNLEANLKEPQQRAIVAIQRKLRPAPKDDVRYIPTLEESVARMRDVTLDQVKNLYREQLGGQAGEVAIVGDFDAPEATQLLAGVVKDWKATVPYRRIAQTPKAGEAGREVIQTPDKANALYVAGHTFALRDDNPDYAALRLADFIFGEAPLAARLSVRVRGKEGLSYGVGSQLNAQSLDPLGVFLMFAICNPANMEKVDKTIAEELEKILKEGVTEKEVEEGRKALLETLKVRRGSDAALASMLGDKLHVGRTFAYDADLEKKIGTLTADQVSAAFRKHVDPKKLGIVHAGDFEKKDTKPK
jgi:zinc protease